MKILLPCLLYLLSTSFFFGQELINGLLFNTTNDEKKPCITSLEYEQLNKECKANCEKLGLTISSPSSRLLSNSLLWPIRSANGLNDCDYHFIGAYVDQDTSSGIKDFNCGTNTYNGHQGTDIAVWPYGFYKMDNNQIEVVAAAAGTIVQKADGNYDRNCTTNSLTANSIILQHADGSQTLYWHMKKNSVTPKNVGQTVVAGEYLGVVGSSGSSSGPHLHFEVRTASGAANYNDPYSGTCNTLNTDSWWATQKPYLNPAILKVSVNTTDLAASSCPNTEIPNESSTYNIPFQGVGLAPGYAKFYVFIREIPVGSSLNMKILNPNGSTFNSWTSSISTFYKVAYLGFSKLLPTIAGEYTFEANYNGTVCSKKFTITTNLGVSTLDFSPEFYISPNPATDKITIFSSQAKNGIYTFSLINEAGQKIQTEQMELTSSNLNKTLTVGNLPEGTYFLLIESDKLKINKKILIHRL